MIRKSYLFLLALPFLFTGCFQDELDISTDRQLQLQVSSDSIVFDTLFTARGSITQRFRIYNPNKPAIRISEIGLQMGEDSPYSITISGQPGPGITDLTLQGQDSLLVLVTVNIDPNGEGLPFLVTDRIGIWWNSNQMEVQLVAYGQNAHYMPKAILCDTIFTADRPYVLTDTVLVNAGCTLRMEAGTRVYCDQNAIIFVQGRLEIAGTAEQPVLIRNSRLDPNFEVAPGQWRGIFFLEGSLPSVIDYAIIENARTGLYIGTPDEDTLADLTIRNSIVRHHSFAAIQAFTSDLVVENSVFYNAGKHLLFHAAGGHYTYRHVTAVNYPNSFFPRDPAVVFADNLQLSNNESLIAPLSVHVVNSVFWQEDSDVLLVSEVKPEENNLFLHSNVLRTTVAIPFNTVNVQFNFPKFTSYLAFDYQLDSISPLIGRGLPGILTEDINGTTRKEFPDIGAYEYIKP